MKQNFTVGQGAPDGVEAFLSVAQQRSFRRAAVELGVTPSAISQAVRALEMPRAALFIRTTHSVGLTEAGERFLSGAKPAFEEFVAASEVACDLEQRRRAIMDLAVRRLPRPSVAVRRFPINSTHSIMLWPKRVVLIAKSTGSALRAVCPFAMNGRQ